MCNGESAPPCRGKRTGGLSLAGQSPSDQAPGEIHVLARHERDRRAPAGPAARCRDAACRNATLSGCQARLAGTSLCSPDEGTALTSFDEVVVALFVSGGENSTLTRQCSTRCAIRLIPLSQRSLPLWF